MAGHNEKPWLTDLLMFFERVEYEDGTQYQERYPGAKAEWTKRLKTHSAASALCTTEELSAGLFQVAKAAAIQILAGALMNWLM